MICLDFDWNMFRYDKRIGLIHLANSIYMYVLKFIRNLFYVGVDGITLHDVLSVPLKSV